MLVNLERNVIFVLWVFPHYFIKQINLMRTFESNRDFWQVTCRQTPHEGLPGLFPV